MNRFLPVIISLALGIALAVIAVVPFYIISAPDPAPRYYKAPATEPKKLTYLNSYGRI